MGKELKKGLKVLCIGDSLALPGHGNLFDDTWFYKLQYHYSDYLFASHFRRAITTQILISEGGNDAVFPGGSDCLEFYLPDIIVIQLGIVDCAPRYFKNASLFGKMIDKLPGKIKTFTYTIIKKIRKRSTKNADVPPELFATYLNTYFERCKKHKVKKVIFIKICIPDKDVQQKSPDLLNAIRKYNLIIDELTQKYPFVSSISPLDSSEKDIYDDGYHPNSKGNKIVFEEILKEIDLV